MNDDWMRKMMSGAGFGQMAGGLAGLFGKGNKNPADAANQQLNQIPGMTNQYYQPYQQAGMEAMNSLKGQYGDLLGGNTQNMLGAGYKESPGYQRALQQAMGAGNNAAAAGGMLGTGAHQQNNMETASDMASKDYNNYIQNQMGLYGMGLQGQQGMNQMGYGANTDFANMLANIQQQKAQYDYEGQNAKNKGNQMDWGNIFGGMGSLAGLFL